MDARKTIEEVTRIAMTNRQKVADQLNRFNQFYMDVSLYHAEIIGDFSRFEHHHELTDENRVLLKAHNWGFLGSDTIRAMGTNLSRFAGYSMRERARAYPSWDWDAVEIVGMELTLERWLGKGLLLSVAEDLRLLLNHYGLGDLQISELDSHGANIPPHTIWGYGNTKDHHFIVERSGWNTLPVVTARCGYTNMQVHLLMSVENDPDPCKNCEKLG
jgi:hypothetical protein